MFVVQYKDRDYDDFLDLCGKYKYPEEDDDVIRSGVQCKLTCENYKSKYHKLIHLDDLEHARKMAKEYVTLSSVWAFVLNIYCEYFPAYM